MNALIGLLVLVTAVAQPDSGMRETARSIVLDPAYQTTPPESLQTDTRIEVAPLSAPRPGLLILRWLLYAVLAFGAVAVVTFLVREWAVPRTTAALHRGPQEKPGGRATSHRNTDDLETLVHDGAYGEAIHVLLLWALEDMARRTPAAVQPAWTSREIIARVELSPEDAKALRLLVRAVEISHFGGRSPTREDFEVCFSQFERLRDQSALGVGATSADASRSAAGTRVAPTPVGTERLSPSRESGATG